MSLTKKDPSLRVAANDPHLVSLGGGRLSTAVTIHYIPIGDTTIGSSTTCSISLNGSGVRPIHCTIYRSEENEVTIVPERDARLLIDNNEITQEQNLSQGAMITIGKSNYLRFNNPAEAQMMRSAMGSNERISMPQIDFAQGPIQQRNSLKSMSSSNGGSAADGSAVRLSSEIENFYETKINPLTTSTLGREYAKSNLSPGKVYQQKVAPIDINGLQCPKVFTADLVTVNMPAKDVLGQKYANFARNLAENHRNDKNVNNALRNNQVSNGGSAGSYVNMPSSTNFIQNTNAATKKSGSGSTDYLTKVHNTTPTRTGNTLNHHNVNAYDRYPKPGTYGGLQIYPMNGVNTDINNGAHNERSIKDASQHSNMSSTETECLEDMLRICTEYADRQNQSSSSITSSPIVQNRIKTNGSLPRDKKSPFYNELSSAQLQQSFKGSSGNVSAKPATSANSSAFGSSGYENVRLVGQNRVEINGQLMNNANNISNAPNSSPLVSSPKSGYENIMLGKYVPQSPRTKIRTTCMSPKKEQHVFGSAFSQAAAPPTPPVPQPKPSKQSEYDQLIKTFEEKLKLEIQAIEESSRYQPANATKSPTCAELTPMKRSNKNVNNLTLNLQQPHSQQNSPKLSKKPAPAPRALSKLSSGSATNLQRVAMPNDKPACTVKALDESIVGIEIDGDVDIDQLKGARKKLLTYLHTLKRDISELQKQEDEVLRELDLENALVCAELDSVGDTMCEFEKALQQLRTKIHRLEAQRNATRVMEENQQAKLKQSIEMKQDQVKKLKALLKQKPNNECLKEEIHNVTESLDNDRKTFEDLEFQYLEEESEWHAYREELYAEEKALRMKIEEQRLELQHLEKQEKTNHKNASSDAHMLKNKLIALMNELKQCQERVKALEHRICDITGQLHASSSDDENDDIVRSSSRSPPLQSNLKTGVMSQSLFGSAELLCPKRSNDVDIMSKSVNENLFYNNKIELPSAAVGAPATSTPKRPQLQVVNISDADLVTPATEEEDKAAALLRGKNNVVNAENVENAENASTQDERVNFNLSLGSDDFEVNPLERRVPSQDDIDRICKVTLDAPISTKGASTKIFDSIKEIERNRQLLLAQQGHHVIEHERQKMHDLKKKSHDEARAQYLAMLNDGIVNSCSNSSTALNSTSHTQGKELQVLSEQSERLTSDKENRRQNSKTSSGKETNAAHEEHPNQQRRSQPEFETQKRRSSPRPLSEANSELSCDLLSESNANCKSSIELSTTATSGIGSASNRYSAEQQNMSSDDAATKRSSVNSNETTSGGGGSVNGGGSSVQSERKRALPKHQRPLTRYLPIFSPDLNLRLHIESAGHQITLCPHVSVDAHSCRGYLHKLGATFHGWARRWFVLDRQRNAFIYYADKAERKPRGGAYFSTIDEVYLDHLNASKSGRPHCTFIVKTKKRSYHLQAASDAAARIWIDAIITGAQGNLDY